LQRREQEMLRQHRDAWLAPLRAIAEVEAVFRRGFVEKIHLAAPAFLAHGDRLLDLLPTSPEVSLVEAGPVIATLAGCPTLGRIRRLTLSDNNFGDEAIAAFARSPHLGQLVALDLSKNQIGFAGIQALGAASLLQGLRHLDLSYNPIGHAEMQALAAPTSRHKRWTVR
jgi:hypothetical protein